MVRGKGHFGLPQIIQQIPFTAVLSEQHHFVKQFR